MEIATSLQHQTLKGLESNALDYLIQDYDQIKFKIESVEVKFSSNC